MNSLTGNQQFASQPALGGGSLGWNNQSFSQPAQQVSGYGVSNPPFFQPSLPNQNMGSYGPQGPSSGNLGANTQGLSRPSVSAQGAVGLQGLSSGGYGINSPSHFQSYIQAQYGSPGPGSGSFGANTQGFSQPSVSAQGAVGLQGMNSGGYGIYSPSPFQPSIQPQNTESYGPQGPSSREYGMNTQGFSQPSVPAQSTAIYGQPVPSFPQDTGSYGLQTPNLGGYTANPQEPRSSGQGEPTRGVQHPRRRAVRPRIPRSSAERPNNYRVSPYPTPRGPRVSRGGRGGGSQVRAASMAPPTISRGQGGAGQASQTSQFLLQVHFRDQPLRTQLPVRWPTEQAGEDLRKSYRVGTLPFGHIRELYERFAVLAPQMTDQSMDALLAGRNRPIGEHCRRLEEQANAMIPLEASEFSRDLVAACQQLSRDFRTLFMKMRHTLCTLYIQATRSVRDRAEAHGIYFYEHELPPFEQLRDRIMVHVDALAMASEATTVLFKLHKKHRREAESTFRGAMRPWNVELEIAGVPQEARQLLDKPFGFPLLETNQEMPWFVLSMDQRPGKNPVGPRPDRGGEQAVAHMTGSTDQSGGERRLETDNQPPGEGGEQESPAAGDHMEHDNDNTEPTEANVERELLVTEEQDPLTKKQPPTTAEQEISAVEGETIRAYLGPDLIEL